MQVAISKLSNNKVESYNTVTIHSKSIDPYSWASLTYCATQSLAIRYKEMNANTEFYMRSWIKFPLNNTEIIEIVQ